MPADKLNIYTSLFTIEMVAQFINKNLTKICNLTNKQPMEHSSPNAHAIRNSNRHAHNDIGLPYDEFKM